MIRRAAPCILFVIVAACGRGSAPPAKAIVTAAPERRFDFEHDAPGKVPEGWKVPKLAAEGGYLAATVADDAHAGKQSVLLSGSADPGQPPGQRVFGNLMQSFDATPYRGQRVRFRAAVKTNVDAATQVALWLRVDREAGRMGFFDNMSDRPIVAPAWATFEIVGTVAHDARTLNLGVMLIGSGKVWFDDVQFEALGPMPEPEAARPLAGRGLANLVAFTRLLGYVRFFHPSDQAASQDWDAFAIAGVRAIEAAATPVEAAARLQQIFAPVAPTLRVFVGEAAFAPAPPAELVPAVVATGLSVTMWRHHGFGAGTSGRAGGSAYSSERISQEWNDGPVAPPFADPRRPMVVDLGGGLSALLPVALFKDADGTLPHVSATTASAPASGAVSADERAVRLADVALAWTVLQHFYPYFDVVKVDWPAVLAETLAAAATDRDAAAFQRTVAAMVSKLHDGHGTVSGLDSAMALPPISWGIVEGKLVVLSVGEGAGDLEPGDVVVSIDGKPALAALATELTMVSAATPGYAQWKALQGLASGGQGTTLTLEVQAGGATRSVVLTRSADRTEWRTERRPATVAELTPGLWYVDLGRVESADFAAAVDKLARAKAVVFDLRGYPTGAATEILPHLSDAALESARWNVPIATRPDRKEWTYDTGGRWNLPPARPRIAGKIVFLTDERAVSYAESIMGIVESYKLGAIVGGTTAGTNGNINHIKLPGGLVITFTGMLVLKHDFSTHHGVGIVPTLPVARTIAGVAAGRDEVLQAGCKLVGYTCP